MSALLEVRDLSTVFRVQAGDVRAVDRVSYRIEEGRSLAIVGESGCGKSVGALSVMGLVPSPGEVVGGQILFKGRDLLNLSQRELQGIRGLEIAMIFQDPMTSLNPVLSIGRQLMEALRWHKRIPLAESRRQAVDALELVGIPDAAGRLADYPHQFSGGQRQRIMIAMAIVCRPALLIADEPTTALDVTIQAQIVELIADLQKTLGMAVIWITHDLALAGGIVDDVAVMYAGGIVEYGSVGDIFSNPRHPYTIGLLGSMSRFDKPRERRLASIEGSPPDLARLPAGCAFAPRCGRRIDRCTSAAPLLDNAGDAHRTACWRAGDT
jgi:oligopeptide/dipeptide ABC transporter ATP-binding protein